MFRIRTGETFASSAEAWEAEKQAAIADMIDEFNRRNFRNKLDAKPVAMLEFLHECRDEIIEIMGWDDED